ncbi:MAG TPA: gamma-glutamyltransferase, partial [Thermoanaerobaculaceae bacterium]|nr:gamma-glutamyltransferase [Thermoanaerobaculaceae bacterium]
MVFSLLVIGLVAVVFAAGTDRSEGRWFATRSVTVARHGMVAAAHPLAVQVGIDVLKRGGGAVDAAIAVNAALGFMEPVSAGLGGDLFAMVWDPTTGKLVGLNGSGRAPLALTPDKVPALANGTIPPYSRYSWTVPGCADAWFELHERFGRLSMSELLAPTIAYAKEGVPVPQVIAGSWARGVALFKDKPGFAEVFLPGGK